VPRQLVTHRSTTRTALAGEKRLHLIQEPVGVPCEPDTVVALEFDQPRVRYPLRDVLRMAIAHVSVAASAHHQR